MDFVYLGCAVLGGTVLVCQFLMTLAGLGGDHDVGGDHEIGGDHDVAHDHGHEHAASSSWFIGILTFRTLVAALAFFGIAGKFGIARGFEPPATFGLALVAGLGAMFIVAWMMKGLIKLQAEGTVRIDRAVGSSGTVYLTVPANKSGVGKVTLTVQNRTMEYQAVSSQPNELATGTKIVAVAIVGPDTVEVAPEPSSERVAHV